MKLMHPWVEMCMLRLCGEDSTRLAVFFFSPGKAIAPVPGACCTPLAMSNAQISLG